MNKKEIVSYFLNKGILINPEELVNSNSLKQFIDENLLDESDVLILNNLNPYVSSEKSESDNSNLEKQGLLAIEVNKKNYLSSQNESLLDKESIVKEDPIIVQEGQINSNVKIVFSYEDASKKRTCDDFISYFKIRFKSMRPLLQNRQEMQNNISIQRLNMKKDKETVSVIGMVSEIQKTKNGNIMIILEDLTDKIKCVISKDNSELFESAKELVLDEVIGLCGYFNGEIIYTNTIVWPDVPLNKELKKCPEEVYSVFISDTEFGNKYFQDEKWEHFLQWIKGENGSEEQQKIAQKIRYLFIVGDLVDGVGIYPGQEADLTINDIYKQYEVFAEYLKKIPKYISIIISPGNHDAMRIAEPQPPLYKDLAAPVWAISNVINVSNPAIVNIHSSLTFPGFDILMYHGYSFTYFSDKVEALRAAGGLDRIDLILKFLMKKRHLAPTHQSNLYLPTPEKDYLFIENIPDFLITGHVHKACALNYRNVTLLNCSCWLSQTPFQEKLGINPEVGRALLCNLQTREIKIMRF